MMDDKARLLTAAQLSRKAIIYVRQSTLRQTQENTESTRRQYDLREKALRLGWSAESILVIDTDQGQSGASAEGREGFQQLVSRVGLGEVGCVLGLEVSRLARNSSDWHRLLELCALTETWICDEDGLYDPRAFNDRLLLGLKGAMSEAELHVLKARLRGGVLNKARRGELKMPIPVGFVYAPDERVVLDPDADVQKTIRLLFETFRSTGSACQTVQRFQKEGLLFPSRILAGPQKGTLVWLPLKTHRVLQILHNPVYTGAFVYGRRRSMRLPNGKTRSQLRPEDQWVACFPEAHPGYIAWEDYRQNLARLRENAQAQGEERRRGPAREGAALLQGLGVCGRCGKRMTVRYEAASPTIYPVYLCQRDAIEEGTGRHCQRVAGTRIDKLVGERVLAHLTPRTIETVLAVQEEIRTRAEEVVELYRKKVERARYETRQAEARYRHVDPSNRLVAATLEADWNNALVALSQAQEELLAKETEKAAQVDTQTAEALLALPDLFGRLWNDTETQARERKRWLRFLVEDVTLVSGEDIVIGLRFRGGLTEEHRLPLPLPIGLLRKTEDEVVRIVDALLDEKHEGEVVAALKEQGIVTQAGKSFSLARLQALRYAYNLKSHRERRRDQGWQTDEEVARKCHVTPQTLRIWARKEFIPSEVVDRKGTRLFPPDLEDFPVKHAQKGVKSREKSKLASHNSHEV